MTSSGFPKSSGDSPPPHCLRPCRGEQGVAGQTEGLRGFCEDAVAGAEQRHVEVACPSHLKRHPLHPSIAPVPSRGRQEAAGSAALEMVTHGGISQAGGSRGFAMPVAEMWVLGRGAAEGAWVLKLRGNKRSVHEGISAFDILPFVSCCREAGAGIGL